MAVASADFGIATMSGLCVRCGSWLQRHSGPDMAKGEKKSRLDKILEGLLPKGVRETLRRSKVPLLEF